MSDFRPATIPYYTAPDADPVRHRLDLFTPADPSGCAAADGAPFLLYFHGGVWQRGDKGDYRNIGEAFASRGVVTAIVNYRLTPPARHPQHVQDAARAAAWAIRHAAAYGSSPDRVFLSGHSAGGHLVTLLAFDPGYLRAEGIDPEALAGVIALSGVFDLRRPIDDTPEGGFERHIHPPFGRDPRQLEAASPLYRLHPTRVPMLIVLAGNDYRDMQAQSSAFVEALGRHQIHAAFETVPGRGHFELVQAIGSEGDRTTELMARFVGGRAEASRPP